MGFFRAIAAGLAAASLALLAAPGFAFDKVDDLEARTQKEVEDATEILGKVQAGKMDYHDAMKKLKEYRAHAEELAELAPNRGDDYLTELNQIMFWTKKFMPMDFGFAKPANPPSDQPK